MLYTLELSLGSVESKIFHKFEDGRLVYYSYAIHYDKNRIKTLKTEPTPISSIGWDDKSPFTKSDYHNLISKKSPQKKPGLLARLFGA
jgi:hypothetical protein